MTVKNILAALTLLAAFATAGATRVLEQPERAYELSLGQLGLPSTVSGSVTVKPCDRCSQKTHALTSATEFVVNGRSSSFAQLRRVVDELRAHERTARTTFVGVFVDIETGRVRRLILRHRNL